MSAKLILSVLVMVFTTAVQVTDTYAQEQQLYTDVRQALSAAAALSGDEGPRNILWIEGGERYSYYNRDPRTNTGEIRAYSPADDEDKLIFDPAEHTFPETDDPFYFESFEWSNDYRFLVFRTNVTPVYRYSGISDYYYYSIEDETIELVVEDAFTAQLSPDGQKIGYGRNGELYVYDLNSGRSEQLTFDSEEHLYNGRFGWVYEEEFGKVQAWEWSHDSRYIAYWQSDERHVQFFSSTDYEGQYPQYTEIPYPKVGADNPEVRIGVVDVETGDQTWIDADDAGGYIPRIYWTAGDDELAVVHLNRPQNHLTLTFHNVHDGSGRKVMEEKADHGWIDVNDFFAGIEDLFFFPEERDEFLWISDRDGWSHLYRYDYDGNLVNQVTSGEWEVTNVHAVNTGSDRIWYESTEVSPLERHLYSIGFDGGGKHRYTESAGRHSFSMGPDGRFYIDTYSNTETPVQVELRTTQNGGGQLKKLVDNQSVVNFTDRIAYSPRQLFSFTTSDDRTLDGYMIKPYDFDPGGSYPLILNIYGGPGSQGVFNEFETNGWNQYLSQSGYVIVNINNRGGGGYGRDFEKSVYQNLGHPEAEDYVETINWLSEEKSWIDGDRAAIRGHSYGGYLAALAPVLHPGVFKVSIAAAPVTDWRLYDTIYTERYMGLLSENENGYINSSVMAHAENLDARMLVAHSSMDENVHIQNTMQMVRAFTDEGIDIDLRIYPPGDHGVAYNAQSYFLLYQTYTDYLNRHLKP
ncbi:MAG: S9 family peptidase [Balneolaceae bacterium]